MARRPTSRQGRAGPFGVQNGPPVTVDVLVMERCFSSSVALTLDVFATANLLSAGLGRRADVFRCRTLSVDGRPVRSSSGTAIAVDAIAAPGPRDILIVCGPGMADVRSVLGDIRSPAARRSIAMLKGAQDSVVAASCSSTFLLAEAGLLDRRRATTSWWLGPTFRAAYPAVELVEHELLVDTGAVVTAGAALAHTDLVIHLVRRFAGAMLAEACAKYLIVDDTARSQSRFMVIEHLAATEPTVREMEQAIRKNPIHPAPLAELARAAGLTPRTLSRKFLATTGLSPQRFIRRVRLELAAHLLRTTADPVEIVAARVGYADERAFRRAFFRELGTTPDRHRAGRAPDSG